MRFRVLTGFRFERRGRGEDAESAEKLYCEDRYRLFILDNRMATLEKLNEISRTVIGCAMEVHKEVGPVVLESAFRQCMCHELYLRQIPFETELSLPVSYKGMQIETGYRMDLLVCGLIVVELKSVESILSVHEAQLMTYLRLGRYPLGLLINYRVKLLRQGIKRFINSKAITQ